MGNNIRKYQGITPTIGKNVYVDERYEKYQL